MFEKRNCNQYSKDDAKGRGNGTFGGRNHGGSFGSGGFCICTQCKVRVPHERGVKCTTQKCPACGHTLVREDLLNTQEKVVQE